MSLPEFPLLRIEELEKLLLEKMVIFDDSGNVKKVGIVSLNPISHIRCNIGKYSGFNAVTEGIAETAHLTEHLRTTNWPERNVYSISEFMERNASTSLTTLQAEFSLSVIATNKERDIIVRSAEEFYKDEFTPIHFEFEKLRVLDEFSNLTPTYYALRVVLAKFGNKSTLKKEDIRRISLDDIRRYVEEERGYRGYIMCYGPREDIMKSFIDLGERILENVGVGEKYSELSTNVPKENVVDITELYSMPPRDSTLFIPSEDPELLRAFLILINGQAMKISHDTYFQPHISLVGLDRERCIIGIYIPGGRENWLKNLKNLEFIDTSPEAWERGKITLLFRSLSTGLFFNDPKAEIEKIKNMEYNAKYLVEYLLDSLKGGKYIFVVSERMPEDPIPSLM